MVWPAILRYSTTQLFLFVAFHYDMKLIYFGFFFLEGLVQSSKKCQRKRNHYSVIRAVNDNYVENKMFVSKNDQSK